MKIEVLPSGALRTNTYLIIEEDSRNALVIDAPPELWDQLELRVKEEKLAIKALLLTHPHWDHYMDVHRFNEAGIPVYAHKEARDTLENPASQAFMAWPGMEFVLGHADNWLAQGDTPDLGFGPLEVRETPGHCPGSLIFYFKEIQACFVGDVIFKGSVGRSDLPGGNMALLARSIREQIYTLPENTFLYPGHGPCTRVDREKASNPFVPAREGKAGKTV